MKPTLVGDIGLNESCPETTNLAVSSLLSPLFRDGEERKSIGLLTGDELSATAHSVGAHRDPLVNKRPCEKVSFRSPQPLFWIGLTISHPSVVREEIVRGQVTLSAR